MKTTESDNNNIIDNDNNTINLNTSDIQSNAAQKLREERNRSKKNTTQNIKQHFYHGKTKNVTVEVKRRYLNNKGENAALSTGRRVKEVVPQDIYLQEILHDDSSYNATTNTLPKVDHIFDDKSNHVFDKSVHTIRAAGAVKPSAAYSFKNNVERKSYSYIDSRENKSTTSESDYRYNKNKTPSTLSKKPVVHYLMTKNDTTQQNQFISASTKIIDLSSKIYNTNRTTNVRNVDNKSNEIKYKTSKPLDMSNKLSEHKSHNTVHTTTVNKLSEHKSHNTTHTTNSKELTLKNTSSHKVNIGNHIQGRATIKVINTSEINKYTDRKNIDNMVDKNVNPVVVQQKIAGSVFADQIRSALNKKSQGLQPEIAAVEVAHKTNVVIPHIAPKKIKTHNVVKKEIIIGTKVSLASLADVMGVKLSALLKCASFLGITKNEDKQIDADSAELLISEFGHSTIREKTFDVKDVMGQFLQKALEKKPPVLTIMGHVDHGKTSTIDAIRKSNVADKETGGITQKLSAYQIIYHGQTLTFIDTPGHSAFVNIRKRGARLTDLVILLIAADDGVQPQTIEAIKHIQAFNTPFIVAINKIDRPDANPDKVRQQLMAHNVFVEKLGGDVVDVEISAKNNVNIGQLLECAILSTDIMNLRANIDGTACGVILEVEVKKGLGTTAIILIQQGKLAVGQIFVAGLASGKVRTLTTTDGRILKEATPGMPVIISGLDGIPNPGDDFVVVQNDGYLRQMLEYRHTNNPNQSQKQQQAPNPIVTQDNELPIEYLKILINTDSVNSLEAIKHDLSALHKKNIYVHILKSSIGDVSDDDIEIANINNALIFCFNTKISTSAKELCKKIPVVIKNYNIIYQLFDDVHAAMTAMLKPEIRIELSGVAKVKAIFVIKHVGIVAGCDVTKGAIVRNGTLKILRNSKIMSECKISMLQKAKMDVKEVLSGHECGILPDTRFEFELGDIIECYKTVEVFVT